MADNEIVFTDPQRDWVTIERAPFVFRQRRKTGKSGNIYFVPGDSIEQLTAAMNEPSPMPANFWIEVAMGGRPPLPPIATATIDPRHGAINVQWSLENAGFGMHIPPSEIGAMIPRLKALVSNGGGFKDGDEERRALAFCDGVMNVWDDMWRQFIAAAQGGACHIMARADSPLKPVFSRFSPDVFSRFKIDDWAKGDATGPGNAKLFAIHVAPGDSAGVPAATFENSPAPAPLSSTAPAIHAPPVIAQPVTNATEQGRAWMMDKARKAAEESLEAFVLAWPEGQRPYPTAPEDFDRMEAAVEIATTGRVKLSPDNLASIRKMVCDRHGFYDWTKPGPRKPRKQQLPK